MTHVVTGEVRLSYCNLFQARAFEGSEPKFSVMLLIPKSDKETISAIRKAEQAAIEDGITKKWGGKKPGRISSIIYDGDEPFETDNMSYVPEEHPERNGHWFMTVGNTRPPAVVDRQVNPIMDQSKVYSGVWGKVSMDSYPYKFGAKSGVGFGLRNVQIIRDDEPLGTIVRVEDDFEALSDEDASLL